MKGAAKRRGFFTIMAQTPTTPSKINFNSIGQLLPSSIYTAKLDGYKFMPATETRGDMWALTFKITNDEKYNNKKIYRNFMTQGDAAFYLMEALVALGIDPDELYSDDPEGVDIEPLLRSATGANVRLTIGVRSYEDKRQAQLPDGSYPMREVNDVQKIEAI